MARRPLFKRLPAIWQRLDRDDTREDGKGILERLLGVLDTSFDRAHDKAKSLLDLRSADKIPDRWLQYLGPLVGRAWRSNKPHDWNRRKIQTAIPHYSYKGTVESIKDLVAEHGGGQSDITDQASRLLVLSQQGGLSGDDCHLEAADYWHDGAFILRVDKGLDDEFWIDLGETLAGGEVWWFEVVNAMLAVYEQVWTNARHTRHPSTNALEYALGFGALDTDAYLSWDENLPPDPGFGEVGWHYLEEPDRFLGFGELGSLCLSYDGQLSPEIHQTTQLHAVVGGLITAGSNLRMHHTDVPVGISAENPAAPAVAIIQEPPDHQSEDE